MGRYVEHVYINDFWPRWVAIFDLQWKVIESQRFGPNADLPGMMLATIERLAGEGGEIEALPRFGVSFIRRDGVRRLLILTPKDPHDDRLQTFNPFKQQISWSLAVTPARSVNGWAHQSHRHIYRDWRQLTAKRLTFAYRAFETSQIRRFQ
jgi:hypothetical protein